MSSKNWLDWMMIRHPRVQNRPIQALQLGSGLDLTQVRAGRGEAIESEAPNSQAYKSWPPTCRNLAVMAYCSKHLGQREASRPHYPDSRHPRVFHSRQSQVKP